MNNNIYGEWWMNYLNEDPQITSILSGLTQVYPNLTILNYPTLQHIIEDILLDISNEVMPYDNSIIDSNGWTQQEFFVNYRLLTDLTEMISKNYGNLLMLQNVINKSGMTIEELANSININHNETKVDNLFTARSDNNNLNPQDLNTANNVMKYDASTKPTIDVGAIPKGGISEMDLNQQGNWSENSDTHQDIKPFEIYEALNKVQSGLWNTWYKDIKQRYIARVYSSGSFNKAW